MRALLITLTFAILFHEGLASNNIGSYEPPIPHPGCPLHEDPFDPTHLPYPGDCGKFYKCEGGLAYPMKCPSGLHWSVAMNRCEWPAIAQCKEEIPPFLISQTKLNSTPCNREEPIKHPDCPINEDPANPTHLAYPGDCGKFYKCLHGYAYPMSCPPGLHWSIQLNRCDYPNIANCTPNSSSTSSTRSTQKTSSSKQPPTSTTKKPEVPIKHPNCPTNENPANPTLLAYPGNCEKFYSCVHGYAYPMSCPTGLHWSVQINRCDYPNLANCKLNTIKSSGKIESPIPSDQCPVRDDPENPKHLPYPNDCKKFYKCANGLAYPMKCPSGQHWSVKLDRCDWPEVAECEPFDPSTSEKPSTEAPTTTANPLPTSTSKPPPITDACKYANSTALLPHPSDCTKFIQCDYGKGYVSQCPAGLHFSPYLGRCEWPQLANCQVH